MGELDSIDGFNAGLSPEEAKICDSLRAIVNKQLPGASAKLYHGSPVWFIDNNPIVGYSKKKDKIALLFWSGQSFATAGLSAVGKFKAAEASFKAIADIDETKLNMWLEESKTKIWNYRDLPKNLGELKFFPG